MEFFSILVTDYFVFDDNLSIFKDIMTTYSIQNLKTLVDGRKRIESKDNSIISLPRLGSDKKNDIIVKQVDSFLNLNSININNVTIREIEGSGTIAVDLKDEDKLEMKKPQ